MFIAFIILLIYYLLFVRRGEYKAAKPSQPGQEWLYDLPPGYMRKNGIVEINSCYGKTGFIPATGMEVYNYVKTHHVLHGKAKEGSISIISDAKNIYYFKCKNDTINKLYYCPNNTMFQETECIPVNSCSTNGFKYGIDLTNYYECVNGEFIAQTCPQGQIFEYGYCTEPRDPCKFMQDSYIYDYNDSTYKICINGSTQIKQRPKNQYFHPTLRKFVDDTCKDKDGYVPNYKEINNMRYATSFTRCENGIDVETLNCPRSEDDLIHNQVFADNRCQSPVWCKNVFPASNDAVLPGNIFTKNMKNYRASDYLDHFYGYRCNGDVSEFTTLNPGEQIENGKITSACTNEHRVPIVESSEPTFLNYFNCDTNQIESCPPNHFYDVLKKECVPDIKFAHKFHNMQVYSFDNLNKHNGWFKERVLMTEDKAICEQERIPHFNICADTECAKYSFIKQLKRPIYIDDEYECVYHENKIQRRRMRKKRNLNFWKQRFQDQISECVPGLALESGDFLIDSTLHVTCDPENPFVFSASSQAIVKDGVCVPKTNDVYHYTVEANVEETIYYHDVYRIVSHEPDPVFTCNGRIFPSIMGELYKPKDLGVYYYSANVIKCSKSMVIIKDRLSTNTPDYCIKDKILVKGRYNHDLYVTDENSEFIMEDFKFDRTIEGFI